MYFPVNFFGSEAFVVFHLPGFFLDVNACYVAGIHLTKLTYLEWRIFERNAVAEFNDSDFCKHDHYYAVFPLSHAQCEAGGVQAPAELLIAMVEERARQLVLTYRLLREGELCDPAFSTTYVRRNNRVTRRAGIYRESLLAYPSRDVTPLLASIHDRPLVEWYFSVIAQYEGHWRDPGLDAAIHNFNWSYMPLVDESRRLSFLLIALEMLTTGLKRVIRGRNASERLRAAIGLSSGTTLKQFSEQRLRNVRNLVCHGAGATLANPGEEVKHLRDICRIMILQAITVATKRESLVGHVWPHVHFVGGRAYDKTQNPRPIVQAPILEMYNALLALSAAGKIDSKECFDSLATFHDAYSEALFGNDRSEPPVQVGPKA